MRILRRLELMLLPVQQSDQSILWTAIATFPMMFAVVFLSAKLQGKAYWP